MISETTQRHSVEQRCLAPPPAIAIAIARDEAGRFAAGNRASVLRAGRRQHASDTMKSEALREIAAAGPAANPLLILWNLARESKNERVKAWCARETCRQLWGDRISFGSGDDAEVDEETVKQTRVLLAAVFSRTETTRSDD